MHPEEPSETIQVTHAVEIFVRLALITLLFVWCFDIVRPFLVPAVWGIIITIGLQPLYLRLVERMSGRRVAAAVTVSALALVCLLIPAALLSGSLAAGIRDVLTAIEHGRFHLPYASALERIPLIGPQLASAWHSTKPNLEQTLVDLGPHLQPGLTWLAHTAAGAGLAMLHFVIAVVLAGFLLYRLDDGHQAILRFSHRIAGERGIEFTELATATIRSVTRGILGIALIESLLAGLGWLVAGVPWAGLWAMLALILSTLQIGSLPVALPILIYVFLTGDTLTFVLLLVWSLVVGALDHLLKPLLLGRGVDVPMIVIFVGALGGFLSAGVIGLFVGAVVLVVGYRLLIAWLEPQGVEREPENGG